MSAEPLVLRAAIRSALVLTINRPDKLNALDRATIAALKDELDAAADDPAPRAVVLAGAGGKAFAAGADIAEMARLGPAEAEAYSREGQGLAAAIDAVGRPVIAAVDGYALGGGCELALMCDLVIAAESAKFGQPEVTLGLMPGAGGTQRLARLVGEGRALEMLLVGAPIDAARAFEIGLANRVVEGSALDGALALADEIAAVGPEAARACLRAVREGLRLPLGAGLELEARLFGQAFAGDEMREGTAAFMEKRPPRFAGR